MLLTAVVELAMCLIYDSVAPLSIEGYEEASYCCLGVKVRFRPNFRPNPTLACGPTLALNDIRDTEPRPVLGPQASGFWPYL